MLQLLIREMIVVLIKQLLLLFDAVTADNSDDCGADYARVAVV